MGGPESEVRLIVVEAAEPPPLLVTLAHFDWVGEHILRRVQVISPEGAVPAAVQIVVSKLAIDQRLCQSHRFAVHRLIDVGLTIKVEPHQRSEERRVGTEGRWRRAW